MAIITGPRLRRGVRTGVDNVVRVAPFAVVRVVSRRRWDPSTQRLPVSYVINDPNGRVVSGRILYQSHGPQDSWITLYRTTLTPVERRHGKNRLAGPRQWDGIIRDGPADRIGQRVTADLSRIRIVVQVWNTTGDLPTPTTGLTPLNGLSDAGCYVAGAAARVAIDAIASAEWRRNWVVPYPPPSETEPEADRGYMKIAVRNVREGESVRIAVTRINDIRRPETDYAYYSGAPGKSKDAGAATSSDPQPGLQGLAVQDGRVVRPDGGDPYIVFDQYELHWVHPGNNFYAFHVAFGPDGDMECASERDFRRREKRCLHMRFTFLVHVSIADIPNLRAQTTLRPKDLACDAFIKNAESLKHVRVYRLTDELISIEEWERYVSHRYGVLFVGHSGPECMHPLHPKSASGSALRVPWWFPEPDQNRCPTDMDRKRLDSKKFGGCGFRKGVYHVTMLGGTGSTTSNPFQSGTWYQLSNVADEQQAFRVWGYDPAAKRSTMSQLFDFRVRAPKFLWWMSGFCTMLTTNLGQAFVESGARYYCGWIHPVAADWGGDIPIRALTRWIWGAPERRPA